MTANFAAKTSESYLAGLAPCLFPRLGATSKAQKRPMSVKVNMEQSSELQKLLAESEDALSGTLRAAWAVFLWCYTGSEDVCFGYQETANLGRDDDKPDMRPVRLVFEEDTTLMQLVERAKDEYAENHHVKHEIASSETVGHQLFNTMLEVRIRSSTGAANVGIAPRPLNMVIPEYCRLRVLAKIINNSVGLFLEWWSCDMTVEQATGVASTFDKVLSYVITRSDCTVGKIDCFSDRHREEVSKFNSFPLEKMDRCIHEVIRDQVLQRPDSEAICAWDGNFTFQELDQLSSRLAYQLVELGVGPEVRVPLCFDKSVSLNPFFSFPSLCPC